MEWQYKHLDNLLFDVEVRALPQGIFHPCARWDWGLVGSESYSAAAAVVAAPPHGFCHTKNVLFLIKSEFVWGKVMNSDC